MSTGDTTGAVQRGAPKAPPQNGQNPNGPRPGGPMPPGVQPMGGPRPMGPRPAMVGNPPQKVPPPPVREPATVQEAPKKNKNKNCCKKVLKFLFSHIGLCGMVIAYSVAGGFIFEHLEATNEQQECVKAEEKYTPQENSTMHKMWEVGQSFPNEDNMEEALIEFQRLLRRFRDDVLSLSYDGKNCSLMGMEGGPGYQWSFPGALLFSVTVITTIGYGNIAPKTFWGRLVCIAYATLGIPLMLLCLANIGDVLADVFRFVYSKICCCGCCRRKEKKRPATSENSRSGTPEAWKAQFENRNAVVVDDDDDDDDDDEEEEERVSVPLTITMAVIAGYMMMGALLFSAWEEWESLEAAYYCFVTISTIGFGDLVPGSANFETTDDKMKMVFTSVYMLFGMAILSMCFSLIQEEIVSKFQWLGRKLGILDKDKEEEEEEPEETPPARANPGSAAPPPQQGMARPATVGADKEKPGGLAGRVGIHAPPKDTKLPDKK